MARNFNGTNQYLSQAATLPSSPLSISVWFKPTVIGTHTVFSFGNLTVNQDRYAVFYFSPGIVGFQVYPGGIVFSSNMVSAGVYNNITTTDDGNTKTLVVNGDIANKVSFNTTQAPTTVNQFALCTLISGSTTPSNFFPGDMAHASIWNAVLSDDDITQINSNVSPLMVKPRNLTNYWPLAQGHSPENDVIKGSDLNLVNAPAVAENPPIANPNPRVSYPLPFTPLNYFPTRNKRMAMIGNIFMPTMVIPDGSFAQEGDASQMLGLPRNTIKLDSVAAIRPILNLGLHVGL